MAVKTYYGGGGGGMGRGNQIHSLSSTPEASHVKKYVWWMDRIL